VRVTVMIRPARGAGRENHGRLFGTDGVRGKAGEFPLDVTTVRRLGAALARATASGRAAGPVPGRPRHTRVGSWIDGELAFGVAPRRAADERRRHSNAGSRVSHATDRLHRRRRDFSLAQSIRRQRHQGFSGRREIYRSARTAVEAIVATTRGRCRSPG
jgi:hypothetical protein